jgi:cation diffusion facilitator family transporter
MIALLIGYEAVSRFLSPEPIQFNQAIPIAVMGLLVNLASVWLLRGDHHGHDHGHRPGHEHDDEHTHEVRRIFPSSGVFNIAIMQRGMQRVFRITPATVNSKRPDAQTVSITTLHPDGTRQTFAFIERDGHLESQQDIPEPHEFRAAVQLPEGEYEVEFEGHRHDQDEAHTGATRDHNIRSTYVHVIADAAVSVLAIVGLVLARAFGWVWMDPLAGIIGALVIANWSWGLVRDTGAILLDMTPGRRAADNVRHVIEAHGDQVLDLHVWRLGPGHMGAVLSVATGRPDHDARFYHTHLGRIKNLSHLTVEIFPRFVVGSREHRPVAYIGEKRRQSSCRRGHTSIYIGR